MPVHPRPLPFTITDEDLPPAIPNIEWNNGLFDGDTTCSTYGYFDGYFNEIGGFTGCEWLYYDESNEYGLSVQWDSLPDTNFQFNWVEASLCGNGYIYGDFSGGTPGYYQGQFVIQPWVLPVHPRPLLLHHRRRPPTSHRRHRVEQRTLRRRHHMQYIRIL